MATLRGYRLSAVRSHDRCVVTIRDAHYRLIAEYAVRTTDTDEAIREVVRSCGRDVLDQVPGYLSVADDLEAIALQ